MYLGNSKFRVLIAFIILINSSLINAMPNDSISSNQSQTSIQEKLPCHNDYSIDEAASFQSKCETESMTCFQICIAFINPSFKIFSSYDENSYTIASEYHPFKFEPESLYRPPKTLA